MRNKALGIPSTPKVTETPTQQKDKENSDHNARITGVRRKSVASPRKSAGNELRKSENKTPVKTPIKRTISNKKDDADVAVGINITSSQNVQV